MYKQKQIEELSKLIVSINNNDYMYDNDGHKRLNFADADKIAEELLKYYQPKIPKNAVVLLGTETEERLEDLLIEFDEMSFYPATLMPNAEECAREWKRKLIYAIGQLRKETAEKLAEKLKAKLNEWLEDNEDLNGKIDFGIAMIELIGVKSLDGEVIAESLIDEICKEIMEV